MALGAFASAAAQGQDQPYVYYLFELPKDSKGCSDCYVPMLVLETKIEKKLSGTGYLITTYERDSIWDVQSNVSFNRKNFDHKERKVTVGKKSYRYQRVRFEELKKLLIKPKGTIPIHRTGLTTFSEDFIRLKKRYDK